jgi:Cu/Ag efflux protein CusF
MGKSLLIAAFALTMSALPHATYAQQETYDGVVTRVDASAGKITIRHGPMPKFDLHNAHSMVFRAADPAMLKQVKAGDKVRFEADRIKGQFTVTKIEKIR